MMTSKVSGKCGHEHRIRWLPRLDFRKSTVVCDSPGPLSTTSALRLNSSKKSPMKVHLWGESRSGQHRRREGTQKFRFKPRKKRFDTLLLTDVDYISYINYVNLFYLCVVYTFYCIFLCGNLDALLPHNVKCMETPFR